MRGDENCFLRNSYYTGFQKQESISLMFFGTGHEKLRVRDEALNEALSEALNDNELRLVKLIIGNPLIKQKDIIKMSGISRAQIQCIMRNRRRNDYEITTKHYETSAAPCSEASL